MRTIDGLHDQPSEQNITVNSYSEDEVNADQNKLVSSWQRDMANMDVKK